MSQMNQIDQASPEHEAQWRRLDQVLHRFFRGRVADDQLRADLVQDVLLRMQERREQLREHGELPDQLGEPPNDAPRVLGAWLRVQIEQLPARYRDVLELTELRGLSQREAATTLGLPYSTIKSRVQRGRERLHAELLSCCAVELDVRGHVTDFAPRPSSACGCTPTTCKPREPEA
jgi:RNA polymerase sigma-70 factor, ECF subfamily